MLRRYYDAYDTATRLLTMMGGVLSLAKEIRKDAEFEYLIEIKRFEKRDAMSIVVWHRSTDGRLTNDKVMFSDSLPRFTCYEDAEEYEHDLYLPPEIRS